MMAGKRNYKCPSCGGEFDVWENAGLYGSKQCPFCGTEKGNYGPSLI